METSAQETQATKQAERITIKPPNQQAIAVSIRGTAPLGIHKFADETAAEIQRKHEEGGAAKSRGGQQGRP